MSDDRLRHALRERDRLPCRETFEAVDRERARAGDGPWLPQSDSLAWETFCEIERAWGVWVDLDNEGPGLILGLDDDGLIRWHDPRTFDPHEDDTRAASPDAILMRNVVPVEGRTQRFVNRTPEEEAVVLAEAGGTWELIDERTETNHVIGQTRTERTWRELIVPTQINGWTVESDTRGSFHRMDRAFGSYLPSNADQGALNRLTPDSMSVGVMRSPDADGVITLSVGDERRSQDVSRLAPNEWHRLAVTPGEIRFELASNTRGQVWLDPP